MTTQAKTEWMSERSKLAAGLVLFALASACLIVLLSTVLASAAAPLPGKPDQALETPRQHHQQMSATMHWPTVTTFHGS